MTDSHRNHPPRWLDRLLEWFCSDEFLEIVQGDLHEIYRRNGEKKGKRRADWLYLRDVLDLFRPFALGFTLPHFHLTTPGMYKNYLATALRNFQRQFGFSTINILGLAIGMAAFMIILTYVSYELSYDDHLTHKEQLYKWNTILYQPDGDGNLIRRDEWTGAKSSPPYAPLMKENFPEVEEVARLAHCPTESDYITVSYIDENEEMTSFNANQVYFADAPFLRMFEFQMLAGDSTALQEPNTVVLSASTAARYFGSASNDIVGKVLQLPYPKLENVPYRITGIFQDIPDNSHLQADILLSYRTLSEYKPELYEENWHHQRMYTYLQFHAQFSEARINQNLNQYDQLINKTYQAEFFSPQNFWIAAKLIPVDDIYLKSDSPEEMKPHGNEQTVYFSLMIGLLIIIIAWVNYVNLTTARAVQRAKEIGVRKVAGASRGQLTFQFLSEAFLINLLATLVALLIIWLTLPYFRQLTGTPLSFQLWFDGMTSTKIFFLVLGVLCLISTLLSGLYPALVLSSFKPIKTIKGKLMTAPHKGVSLRSGLAIVQFTMSVVLIAGTYLMHRQLSFMQNQSLGFDKEQMLVIQTPTDTTLKSEPLETFKEELLRHSFVDGTTASSIVPGHQILWTWGVGITEEERVGGLVISVDEDFLDTYDFTLIAGRNFSEDYPTDKDAIILSETFVKEIGFPSPQEALNTKVWLSLGEKEVIGIVKDFNQYSLKDNYQNICFLKEGTKSDRFDFANYDRAFLSVKIDTKNLKQNMSVVQEAYQAHFPGFDFESFFLDDRFNQQYQGDTQFGKIFGVFAGLAIFIACLGILGLSSFLAVQKSKEIGIRKVLGASVSHIVLLLSSNFMRLVLLATLIALPIAYLVADRWLEDYAFRIDIGWWFFVIPAVVVLLIATLTISVQTVKAALTNPVNSLKHE